MLTIFAEASTSEEAKEKPVRPGMDGGVKASLARE